MSCQGAWIIGGEGLCFLFLDAFFLFGAFSVGFFVAVLFFRWVCLGLFGVWL